MQLKKRIRKDLIGTSDYPSNKVFTVSNFITVARLVLTFVFLLLFISDVNRYIALIVYAIAACTDWLDGQIARMTKTVSWLGKLMDPLVDRALLFTGVLGLVIRGELPIWICVLIIARDAYLAFGGSVVGRFHKRPVDVVFTGKAATALLMSGFTFMLLGRPIVDGFMLLPAGSPAFPGLNGQSAPLGIYLVYLGTVFSMITAVVYTLEGALLIKRSREHPECEEVDYLNPEIVESEDDASSAGGLRDGSEVE